MKVFLLASLLVVANAAFLEVQDVQFQVFKDEHNKTYQNQVEEVMRFSIFSENLRAIEEHNARYEQGLELYKKGINEFSDMTQYEFTQLLGLYTKLDISATDYVMTGVEVPASVDWRKKGYVTPVKNQGQCGSCWAFAVTGATEGAYYRKHKKLVSLSEQQLVDCSTINKGCKGGYMAATFNYIKDKGLESETSYPYNARDGKCHYSSSKVVTKISSHVSIRKNERALLEAVATVGPVAVAIDASHLGSYSSGIYSDTKCKPSGLNHGVLIVGYGTEKGKNYWIVKNSWGKSWGESGYFRIERGTNRCGIAEDDSYPVIN